MIKYELEYHDDRHLLIARVKGDMLPEETAQMGLKARTKAKELDYKLILGFYRGRIRGPDSNDD